MSKEFLGMSPKDLTSQKEGLNFLHVEEFKEICTRFLVPTQGKKGALISRILHFVQTGEVTVDPKIPESSCARRGEINDLHPNARILKGAYKNDLKTRLFFKKLIGEHFHFTAFGVDWIQDRWKDGNPPTYQEFASMWIAETKRRKEEGSRPKEEWAYINFTQRFMAAHPKGVARGSFRSLGKRTLSTKRKGESNPPSVSIKAGSKNMGPRLIILKGNLNFIPMKVRCLS